MRGLGARTIEEYVAASALDPATAAARGSADPRYRAGALRPPRRIGRRLATFDCINCDKCLPACPNDANFVYETEPLSVEYADYRVEGGRAVPVAGATIRGRERQQIGNFQDFCNDCGNCDTFCPEDGGPYREKPRFFGSLEVWRRAGAPRRASSSSARDGRVTDVGASRRRRVPPRGGPRADRAIFDDGRVTLELRHRERVPVAATVAPRAHPTATRSTSAPT